MIRMDDEMKHAVYRVFQTPLGVCGIAWRMQNHSRSNPVVIAFQLPEATRARTEFRVAQRTGATRSNTLPRPIAALIKKVNKHLLGDAQDFRDIAVDLTGTGSFASRVYAAARTIPAGRSMTYGELAKAMDHSTASRAVGQALGKNPIPLIIPCHRVLAAGNKPGGFSAHGGWETKAHLLAVEGVVLAPARRSKRGKSGDRNTFGNAVRITERKPQQPGRPRHPLPAFITRALRETGLAAAYAGRPPYQRNDYVGWITRAKLKSTREKRLAQMLDELKRGDVYMKMAYRKKRPAK